MVTAPILAIVTDEARALAVYGTLAPGESNHWVVRSIGGEWVPGRVRGYQFEITWGPADGYAGFLPEPDGNDVAVMVLVSEQLDKNWHTIDDFEGDGYRREVIAVTLDDGTSIDAWIYVALTDS